MPLEDVAPDPELLVLRIDGVVQTTSERVRLLAHHGVIEFVLSDHLGQSFGC